MMRFFHLSPSARVQRGSAPCPPAHLSPWARVQLTRPALAAALVLVAGSASAQEPSAGPPAVGTTGQPPAAPSSTEPPADPPVPAATDPAAPAAPANPAVPPASTSTVGMEAGKLAIGIPMLRYANTWDVNLEGGVGSVFRDSKRLTFLTRARVGALFVRDNHFYQVGATAEWLSALDRPAFGAQAEYLNLEMGAWFQVGGSIDTKAKPGGMLAAGLSIVGVEAQLREFDGDTEPHVAVLAKLRLPIGILVYGIRSRK